MYVNNPTSKIINDEHRTVSTRVMYLSHVFMVYHNVKAASLSNFYANYHEGQVRAVRIKRTVVQDFRLFT